MNLALCGNPGCDKLLHAEDKIWQVRTDRDISGVPVYLPCCCEKCARELQGRIIRRYEEQLADIKKQTFQIIKLENF